MVLDHVVRFCAATLRYSSVEYSSLQNISRMVRLWFGTVEYMHHSLVRYVTVWYDTEVERFDAASVRFSTVEYGTAEYFSRTESF